MPSKFFDQLSAGFTNASRTVSQKVKNLNDTNKLTSQVKTEQNNIHQNLVAIGQKYYDLCRDNPDEEFQAMVEAIIKSEQTIARLQQEIESVRAREPELMSVPVQSTININSNTASESGICPNCGSKLQGDSAFCPHCGQNLTAQPAQYDKIYQQNPVQDQEPESVPDEQPEDSIAQVFASELKTDSDFDPVPDSALVSSFCPYCGNKLSVPDARFCSECGRTL